MIFAAPELTPEDQRVSAEIAAFYEEFRHLLAEPHRWEGQLRRSITAAAVRSSTHIEGYTISEEAAETLIAGGDISAETDEETLAAVTGYRDALSYVQHAARFKIFSWDHTLLSALHFMMTRTERDKQPGEYRTTGVWVVGGRDEPPVYTAPEPDLVPELMGELLDWLPPRGVGCPALRRAPSAP